MIIVFLIETHTGHGIFCGTGQTKTVCLDPIWKLSTLDYVEPTCASSAARKMHRLQPVGWRQRYSLWRWGVTCLFKEVSHETPDGTQCRTSPPMLFFRARLARNARCNTMSHLTAAGCSSPVFCGSHIYIYNIYIYIYVSLSFYIYIYICIYLSIYTYLSIISLSLYI